MDYKELYNKLKNDLDNAHIIYDRIHDYPDEIRIFTSIKDYRRICDWLYNNGYTKFTCYGLDDEDMFSLKPEDY